MGFPRPGSSAVAAAIVAALALSAPAQAAIPTGDLIVNGDGETGTAATDDFGSFCPQGWTCGARDGTPRTTLVRYGTTTFPSTAESARIGGGRNFFAGGPNTTDDWVRQIVNVASEAASDVDNGNVQVTEGGCLGGWRTYDDYAFLETDFFDGADKTGTQLGGMIVRGPSASDRGFQTELLPRSKTAQVPVGTRSVVFYVDLERDHPSTGGVYDNGYADNVSLRFSAFPGPPAPVPACQVAGGGGGGGGGQSGGAAPGAHAGGPHEKLAYKRTQDVDRLVLYVRSDEAVRVTVGARVSVPAGVARTLRFKRVRKNLTANRRTKIRVRLSRKRKAAVKRALHRGRRLRAKLALTAVDAAGKRQVNRATIRLKD